MRFTDAKLGAMVIAIRNNPSSANIYKQGMIGKIVRCSDCGEERFIVTVDFSKVGGTVWNFFYVCAGFCNHPECLCALKLNLIWEDL